MTEDEFLERWSRERPMYEAWGGFVSSRIVEGIRPKVAPLSTDLFIRVPIKPRVKADGSFVTKAFYRGKGYDNPFQDITDKVGLRVVVLLPSDMLIVSHVIESCPDWNCSKDRDYEVERDENPSVFDYQSNHYIVRCKGELKLGELVVTDGTPCEVQVRTILQHAYSELTHDTIYKPSVTKTPSMLRTAAKSMALIEATTDNFVKLVDEINEAVGANRSLAQELSELYRTHIGSSSDPTKADGLMIEAFAPILGTDGIKALESFLSEKPFVAGQIKDRARFKFIFRQPSILLAYMAVSRKPYEAASLWPLTPAEVEPIYTDLGVVMPN